MIRTIPLNKLVPSPRNVRRTTNEQADLQLKADIEARGLLQNLVVTAATKPRGAFAVEAGGRRLRALQTLAQEGKLEARYEVCCLVLDSGTAAQEASLAENFQRLSMNPADECLAFQQLVDQGSAVDEVARRFGLTTRFVEGRLRLASLAPPIFEALGAGEISLEIAKAFAATPDHDRQLLVFEQVARGYGVPHPDSVRRMMTQATASAADRRARFVGEEAYLAAGGRIERDLFSDEEGVRWLDIAILERLASEKIEALAAQAAAEHGLAFVRPTLDSWLSQSALAGLRRVPLQAVPLTEEEAALAPSLEAQIEDLAALLEDEDLAGQPRQEAEAKLHELGDRLDALLNKPPILDDALKPSVGAFLMLDEQGRPRLAEGYYAEVGLPDGGAEGGDDEEAERVGTGSRGSGAAVDAPLSQRLRDELAVQRRDILAVHVAADPGFALDLAIFLMIDREPGYAAERRGSSLTAMRPSDPVVGFETPDAPATIARAEAEASLDRSWAAAPTRAARFDAFRGLAEDARAAWLGHAVAGTLEASLRGSGERACAFHDHLGRLLGIDVARWWRPTGANYFDRVPKSASLAALSAAGGEALASRYAKAKKIELAQACERIFSGDFIADIEVKEAALAWLPSEMRFSPAEQEGPETEDAQPVPPELSDSPPDPERPSFAEASDAPAEAGQPVCEAA